jgi:Tol biopolymer transport system component
VTEQKLAKTNHFTPLAAAAGALVAVALLVLMLVVNPQPAKAAFPGQNGRIAFASERDGDYDIYTVSSAGTEVGLFQRTDNPAFDTEPAYSPDGSKIAFQSDRNGNTDIYTVNSTGAANLTRITNNPNRDRDPNWSPDGSRIVFSSTRSGQEQIWTVGSTGTEVGPLQVTDLPFASRRPAYAPNGNRIVFQMDSDGTAPNENIWTRSLSAVAGRGYERITRHPAHDEEPAYSPDGSRIAFARGPVRCSTAGDCQINTASPSGVERDLVRISPVFPVQTVDEKPAFSPDGSRIVFDSNRSGNFDIWIVNCSFQRPTFTQITNNPATDYAPDWQSL